MDEVSSHVRLDPAVTVRSWQRLFRLVLESHDGRAPGADSEEKHEPVSDIDTALTDSLKVLDPEGPIREADIGRRPQHVRKVPSTEVHVRKPHHPAFAPNPTLVPATIRPSWVSWRTRFD